MRQLVQQFVTAAVATLCVALAAPASAANKAPQLSGALPMALATEGSPFSYAFPAFVDPEGGLVSYTALGHPSWFAFNPATRSFSGTPPFTETVAGKYRKYTVKVYATDPLGKTKRKSFTLKIGDAAPRVTLALPLPDQTIDEDALYTFRVPDGTFANPTAGVLSYSFAGVPASANVQEGVDAAFWWSFGPPQSTVGTHQVTVFARDGTGATASDSFTLTIVNKNDAPAPADWRIEFQVTEDTPFRIAIPEGFFLDEDGDPLRFTASEYGWFAFDPATRELRGTIDEAPAGWRSAVVTATDPQGAYGIVQVDLIVTPVNDAPIVVTPLEDRVLFAGQSLSLVPVFLDPEWQPIERTVSGLPPWASFANGSVTGTPGPDDSGSWEIVLTATDPHGLSASDAVLVTVVADNHAPENPGHIWFPYAVVGVAYSHSFSDSVFVDADGDPLVLALSVAPAWLAFDPATRTFTGTPPEGSDGSAYVRVTATDPAGATVWTDSYLPIRTPDQVPTGVIVSGTIRPQARSTVDGDTNDPNSPLEPNDAPSQAHVVPFVPAVLNGFVTSTGTGVPGDRFAAVADEYDTFRFPLKAGDRVALQISDHLGAPSSDADLDLILEDAVTLEIVAYSAGIGPGELLTVPRDGTFNVVVQAWNGRSNYVLEVGASSAAALLYKAVDDRTEFVAGEAIVRYRDDDLQRKQGRSPPPTLVRLDGVGGAGKPGNPDLGAWRGVPVADHALREKLETIRGAKLLARDPAIASVDLNFIRRAAATASDPLRAAQWHYDAISLDRAWLASRGSGDTVVAVIDTGVLLAHPDLAANLVTGFDFISSAARARDGDGLDPDPDDPGDGALAGQGSFHGTHVAGTIAAVADNGIGGAGVAPGVRIMPLRVLGADGGTSYDVLQAVRYAAGLANASGTLPSAPVDVINLSLGGGGYSSAEQEAYSAARAAGVIVVAAAGNEATNLPSFPAAYEGVVSVSATDRLHGLAPYSNTGALVDVAAPGGDMRVDADGDGRADGVLSTHAIANGGVRSATYQYLQGTSMAAPHVAGVAALMRSVYPALSPGVFDDELRAGRITDDLGGDGATTRNDRFGWGLINAAKATTRAQALAFVPEPPTFLVVDPVSLVVPALVSEATLRVTRSGPANASITAVTASHAAISVVANGIDVLGFGGYRIAVDRSGLAPGTHAFTIDFRSDLAGDARVWVYVEVEAPVPVDFDNGWHYVLLVDPVSFEVVAQSVTHAFQSIYHYSLLEVPDGEYYLVVGTDHDNDYFVCDPGESCGAYPSLSLLERIVVSGSDVVVPEIGTSVQQSVGSHAASPAVQSRTPTGLLRRNTRD